MHLFVSMTAASIKGKPLEGPDHVCRARRVPRTAHTGAQQAAWGRERKGMGGDRHVRNPLEKAATSHAERH